MADEILGDEIVLGQALSRLLRIRLGKVTLVDRHDDRATRCLRMLDRLDGLGHRPLRGRDH